MVSSTRPQWQQRPQFEADIDCKVDDGGEEDDDDGGLTDCLMQTSPMGKNSIKRRIFVCLLFDHELNINANPASFKK